MNRLLLASCLSLLFSVQAHALEPISHAEGADAYDRALKSYSCVDYDAAFKLFQKNAERGHALSQYMMGVMLSAGQGASEDDPAAYDWFMRAAQQDLADAYFALGDMHSKGEGTSKDTVQALFWFELAKQGGHSLASDMIKTLKPSLAKEQLTQISQQIFSWMARFKR